MTVYIGADHRGFNLKEIIKERLGLSGYQVEDCGAKAEQAGDDYVDYAISVARKVAGDELSRGILICGSGTGMCVAANKIKRIRAVLGVSSDQVYASRHDDDVNILCLPADFISEETAYAMVQTFFLTSYSQKPEYQRRIGKIFDLEDGNV